MKSFSAQLIIVCARIQKLREADENPVKGHKNNKIAKVKKMALD